MLRIIVQFKLNWKNSSTHMQICASKFMKFSLVLLLLVLSSSSGKQTTGIVIQITGNTSQTLMNLKTDSLGSGLNIAVLDSSAKASFWTDYGSGGNQPVPYTTALSADGFNVTLIDNEVLMNGSLSNYDVVFLPESAPNATAAQSLKDWWMAGGHLFVVGYSITYVLGFELLGHEFNTSVSNNPNDISGRNDYWRDASSYIGYVGDTSFPVTTGLSYNQSIEGELNEPQLNQSRMLSSSIGSFYHPLVIGTNDTSGGAALNLLEFTNPISTEISRGDLVSAIDLPHRGKIVYSWDPYPSLPDQILNNSMQWFATPEEIPHVPNSTPLPQNAIFEQGMNVGINFTLLDNDPTYYTLNITKDGASFYNFEDQWTNNTEIVKSVTLTDVGVYGVNFTAYDLHENYFNQYFEVTVTATPTSSQSSTSTTVTSTVPSTNSNSQSSPPSENTSGGNNSLPGIGIMLTGFGLITTVYVVRFRKRNH